LQSTQVLCQTVKVLLETRLLIARKNKNKGLTVLIKDEYFDYTTKDLANPIRLAA
jgi:hypothetical protein